MRRRGAVAMGAAVLVGAAAVSDATHGDAQAGQTVTYSAVVNNVAPPATNFSGAGGGGDGWAVGLTQTRLYNVFHHNGSFLGVNCHNQSDASSCWSGYKTIRDGSGHNFSTSGQPGLYVDQASGHLFVYATRTSDSTGGVVCIDTTQPANIADPFCGFTALTAVGAAPIYGWSQISDPVQVGSKWYAFSFANGTPTATQDKLLCFDLSTLAACASQPFAVNTGVTSYNNNNPPQGIAAFGNEIIVPSNAAGQALSLGCFDASTATTCTGSWPVSTSVSQGATGAPFTLLNGSGSLLGFCFAYSTDPCWTLSGAIATTPSNLPSVTSTNDVWNGPGWTTGPRVYISNGNVNQVRCFDYSANASCAHFPKGFSNLGYIYTVNPDWQRPTCIWVNADNGSAQIQNFDAFTGGVCGSGPIRVLSSTAIAPGAQCVPGAWSSLQVTTPSRSAYTSATVQFVDADGNTIPGTSTISLDSNGAADLTGLNLNAGNGLPQFLLTFTGASNLTQVVTKLTWTGTYDPSCVQSGTTVTGWTMTAGASPTTTTHGNAVQLFVTGVPSGATGNVTFTDSHNNMLCTAALSSGAALCTSSALLAAGGYSVTATYTGDSNYPSATATTAFTITQATPTMSATANPPSQQIGSTVQLNASLPSDATGSVTFTTGSTTLCTANVSSGSASCNTPVEPLGTYPVTAAYGGDTNYAGATATTTFTITTIATALSASAAPASTVYSNTVQLTGSGLPAGATGTVIFTAGASTLCSASVVAGLASCATGVLDVGSYTVTATYGGDSSYAGSVASTGFTITQATTTTTLSSSANPAVTGQAITFTATVARDAPATGAPSGTVTFSDNGTTIPGCLNVPVVQGVATCSTTYMNVGSATIAAAYSGDANDVASTASTLNQTVAMAGTTTTVTSSPNPSTFGQAVTIIITTKSAAPATGNPTGTVTLSVDGKVFGTYTLDSTKDSQAVLSTSTLATGSHRMTAVYGGDANYTGSTGTTSGTQVVFARISTPNSGAVGGAASETFGALLVIGGALSLLRRRRTR